MTDPGLMKWMFDITTTRQSAEKVIEANLDYLVRFAILRVGNRYDAEDIVHEAATRLLETDLSRVKRNSLRMYLFRIVYNLCKDFLISGNNIRRLQDDDNNIPDPIEAEADHEEADRLRKLLEKLPDREAEIIRMNIMDELSFVEISQILSIPASTVKSRFKSGMNKLKSQYFKNL